MGEHSVTALEFVNRRLARLERQNRRLKQGGLVVLLLAAAAASMAQMTLVQPVISREFLLTDRQGRTTARLTMSDRVPVLTFMDDQDRVRLKLFLGPDGAPKLLGSDASGRIRDFLATDPRVHPLSQP